MDTWPRIAVSALTVLSFGLAAWGLFHAFLATTKAARRVERDRLIRHRLREERDAERAQIGAGDYTSAERLALQRAAEERWQAGHRTAGLDPWVAASVNFGSEPIAEQLVRELAKGTLADLRLAGAGLLLGLLAALWGVWL